MGFGREARRVRDETLPHAQRLRALEQCLEWTQPIGFHPSWHYLEVALGVPRESIDFLVPAIDLLERERTRHLELDRRYATLRRRLKQQGSRVPRPDTATPTSPARWHGDERQAAAHALTWWLQHHSPADFAGQPEAEVAVGAARVLAAGQGVTSLDVVALQRSLVWARRATTEHPRAHQVLYLLEQIYVALRGAPVIGCPWTFTPSPDDQERRQAVARTCFRVPLGLWRSTPREDMVGLLSGAAGDLLVLGYDTPALREVAGLSPGDSIYQVEPFVSAAVEQLGIDDLLSTPAVRAGLEARLELYLAGDLALRELSSWAHRAIGHDGADDLQPFAYLDDIYDVWEYAGRDLQHLDVVTRQAARDFLAGRAVPRLDMLEPPAPGTAS
ncbi:hypothetical protein [Pimelobacter sp. 30-1]|uniref:hypothetical protein n=1 Tax=Pimelobacter sp. 30-1 TaxID=2004991 RepID=UPI001C042250|nr:hypothetical protein [Pimelobacter sp. 30-1]MBU2693958.1 hypothetical protein [Pimelobacter sp. 30-1]